MLEASSDRRQLIKNARYIVPFEVAMAPCDESRLHSMGRVFRCSRCSPERDFIFGGLQHHSKSRHRAEYRPDVATNAVSTTM